jgi:hypothetical protein
VAPHSDTVKVGLLPKIFLITKLAPLICLKYIFELVIFVSFQRKMKGPAMKIGQCINAGSVNRKPHIHIKTFFIEIMPMTNRDWNNKTTFEVKTIKNFCSQFTSNIICLLSMQNQQQGSCLCCKLVSVTVLVDTSAKTNNLRIDESFRRAPACIHLP